MKLLIALSIAISILFISCKKEIPGCTDVKALNYDQDATADDGSCLYDDSTLVAVVPYMVPYYCEIDTIICRWRIDSVHYVLSSWSTVYEDNWLYPSGYLQLYNDNSYVMLIDDALSNGTFEYTSPWYNFGTLKLSGCHMVAGVGFSGGDVYHDGFPTDNIKVRSWDDCADQNKSGKKDGDSTQCGRSWIYKYYFSHHIQ